MGNNLEGSMDGRLERPDERLERASESRREALRLGGGGAMISSGLCTWEEIDRFGDCEREMEKDEEGKRVGKEGGRDGGMG
jgi:hypothetical protein